MIGMLGLMVLAAWDGVSIAQWAFNVVFTLLLGYVARKQNEVDKLRDELKQQARSLVAAELVIQTQPLTTSIDALAAQMQAVVKRLDDGERDFKTLASADHQIELRAQQIFHELETDILRQFATREDVKALDEKVSRLQQLLAGDLVARVERASQAMEQAAAIHRAAAERISGRSIKP